MLGCLQPGTFVKEFEAAANAAEFGVPTEPVKSQFGYHVILVTKPKYADFKGQIAQALQQQGPGIVHDLQMQAMNVAIAPMYGTGALGVDSQAQVLRYRVTPPEVPESAHGPGEASHHDHHHSTPLAGG